MLLHPPSLESGGYITELLEVLTARRVDLAASAGVGRALRPREHPGRLVVFPAESLCDGSPEQPVLQFHGHVVEQAGRARPVRHFDRRNWLLARLDALEPIDMVL